MGERILEIKVISAEELKQVKWAGKMSPYLVVWIYPDQKVSSTACMEGGKNPKWDETLQVKVQEEHLHDPGVTIGIEVFHNGVFGEVSLGTANFPLTEVTKEWKDDSTSTQYLAYQLRRPSGRTQGVVNLAISLVPKGGGSGEIEASATATPEVALPPTTGASPVETTVAAAVESSSLIAAAKPELEKETGAAGGKTEKVEAKGEGTKEPSLAPYPGAVLYVQGLLPQPYSAPAPAGARYPQGYPPAPQGYPPPQVGYPPPQVGYAPPQASYMPPPPPFISQADIPPWSPAYAPPQAGYAPSQPGYAPSQAGYIPSPSGFPPTGYPLPPGYGYAPPGAYPLPQTGPQGGYSQMYQGYPPYAGVPAASYPYPQQPQKPNKSGGLGAGVAGLGLGLGAGLLGGLLIEEALDNDDNDYDNGGDF